MLGWAQLAWIDDGDGDSYHREAYHLNSYKAGYSSGIAVTLICGKVLGVATGPLKQQLDWKA